MRYNYQTLLRHSQITKLKKYNLIIYFLIRLWKVSRNRLYNQSTASLFDSTHMREDSFHTIRSAGHRAMIGWLGRYENVIGSSYTTERELSEPHRKKAVHTFINKLLYPPRQSLSQNDGRAFIMHTHIVEWFREVMTASTWKEKYKKHHASKFHVYHREIVNRKPTSMPRDKEVKWIMRRKTVTHKKNTVVLVYCG
jgi:hypothetical protein